MLGLWLVHSLPPGPWGPRVGWLHCHHRGGGGHCFLTSAVLHLAPGKAFSFIFSTASPNILGGRDDPISQMWRLRCTGWEGFIQGSSNPWVQAWPQWSHNSVIFSVPWAPTQPLPPFLCPVGRKGVWESLSKPPTCMCMSVCRVCVHVECARVCMCMCMHTCVIGAEMELLL